jgi:hypothetical protein
MSVLWKSRRFARQPTTSALAFDENDPQTKAWLSNLLASLAVPR